ncbi:XRE family transcriptional regulator [Ruminococcaceae bacterium AF10-16]|jgi:transcriptional regulator with XRE-family HTH domain|nr:XRE family transcriptional regulator [Ruminococcaceae bacterium AF10-16]
MAIDYKVIGSNIKVCRIRKNLRQAQLAEMVGVSSQHISHIECGRTTVGLPLLISISQALSVDLYTLLDGIIESRPKTSYGIELENVLKDATQEQLGLCLSVCRTIMGYGKENLTI